jgi:hypothetical protein
MIYTVTLQSFSLDRENSVMHACALNRDLSIIVCLISCPFHNILAKQYFHPCSDDSVFEMRTAIHLPIVVMFIMFCQNYSVLSHQNYLENIKTGREPKGRSSSIFHYF